MRRYLLEVLCVLLIGGSMAFFYECIRFLAQRDYVAASLLMLIGFAVIRVGAEIARLALVRRP
ncbi:MAG: hypothetical protein CSB49_08455 [Proteobacteria bacterium]|nr:MAG: hypothetical protein CSB49_08455 [Pseudomonadota bacterium]